jgi:hypothetical protein
MSGNKKRSLPWQRPRKRLDTDLKIGHYMELVRGSGGGDDADETSATAFVFKLDVAGDERE